MKPFNPYTTELIQSGNPNLLYAPSSDRFSTYAVYFSGPAEITCTCIAFERGVECRHRRAARLRFCFVPEIDETIDDATWANIQDRIEAAAEIAAYGDLFADEAA